MKTNKQFAPLEGEQVASENVTPLEKTKSRKKMIPGKDDDFGDLCETVNESWKQNPDLTLRFITQPEFEVLVTNYNSSLGTRQEAGGGRPNLTGQLEQADAEIDHAIGFVKLYLKKKYEKNATDHYAAFGIVRIGKGYQLPLNREKRKNALKLINKQIVAEGFTGEKYGKQFWSDMNTNYTNLLKSAKGTDSTVSDSVGDKNLTKARITLALNSLIGIIIHNMPDTYPAELRKWGFQKEKY